MKSIVLLIISFVGLYVLGVWSVNQYVIPNVEKNFVSQDNKKVEIIKENNRDLITPSSSPTRSISQFQNKENKLNTDIDKYICPSCIVKDKQTTQMELESDEMFETVSSWYESIADNGNSSTIVTTNTNGTGNSVIKFNDENNMKVTFLINNYYSKVNVKITIL